MSDELSARIEVGTPLPNAFWILHYKLVLFLSQDA